MKTSIILPTLRLQNALDCINAVKANTYTPYELLIITSEEIARVFPTNIVPDLKIIIDDKCIGTTYPINLGLKQSTGDYIVTLSDDARVCPHWLDHMLNFLEKQPKDQIILGNFRVFQESHEMAAIGYFGLEFAMFPILSRENLNKIGIYYSEDFFAFFSDPFLGITVAEKGGRVLTCPTAFIYHPPNSDTIHNGNQSRFWRHDEDMFIKKCSHLGPFRGCEIIQK